MLKSLPVIQETWVQSLGEEDPLEKGMATNSSVLAWEIPRTKEPGGYSPWGCKEYDGTEQLTRVHVHTHTHAHPGGAVGKESTCQCRRHKRYGFERWVRDVPWGRTWQPTSVLLPGKSHGQRRLVGYSPWVTK